MQTQTFQQRMLERTKAGMMTGAVGQLNRRSIELLTSHEKCPDIFKTELGKKSLEGAVPMAILFLLQTPYASRIPDALRGRVEQLANHAFDSFTQDSAAQIVDLSIEILGPVLQEWIATAQQMELPALADQTPAFEIPAATVVQQPQKAVLRDLG